MPALKRTLVSEPAQGRGFLEGCGCGPTLGKSSKDRFPKAFDNLDPRVSRFTLRGNMMSLLFGKLCVRHQNRSLGEQ